MSEISVDTILSAMLWNESSEKGTATITSSLFSKSVTFTFYTNNPLRITSKMRENIAGYLQFKDKHVEKIKDLLWENCLFCCDITDYGFEKAEGKTIQESNLQNFSINSKEDAYLQTRGVRVVMDEEDETFSNRYYSIRFDVPWSDLAYVIIKNDIPIAVYGDDPYFGWYEEGGKYYDKLDNK